MNAQPGNDLCSNAASLPITTSTGDFTPGTTIGSTSDSNVQSCFTVSETVSDLAVFYTFVGTGSLIKISTCSDQTTFPTALSLFPGCARRCQARTSTVDLDCPNSNGASITFTSVPDTVYYVAVHGRVTGTTGNFAVQAFEFIPPANTYCFAAIEIVPVEGETVSVSGSTVNATIGTTPFNTFLCSINQPKIFYEVVGTGNRVMIDTCSSETSAPTSMFVAESCDQSTGSIISEIDADCPNPNAATLQLDTLPGLKYVLSVCATEAGDEVEDLTVRVTDLVPPSNNDCSGAIQLEPGSSIQGTTANATSGPDLGFVVRPTGIAPTVFYTVVGNGNEFRASTCSNWTNYETAITVTSVNVAGSCGSSIAGSFSDTSCTATDISFASVVSWETEADQIYNIVVHGRFAGALGDFGLSLVDLDASNTPSMVPSLGPSSFLSANPSAMPSSSPSNGPSMYPSSNPSNAPSLNPSNEPSLLTNGPTSAAPTTSSPTSSCPFRSPYFGIMAITILLLGIA